MAAPRASPPLVALLLLTVPLAGCTEPAGLPRITVSLADTTVAWGEAAQLTIRNVGDGAVPAPLVLEVVSGNGSVVRTYQDVTGGRGLPAGGQVGVGWNGSNDAGRPVLWGTYTLSLPDYDRRAQVELLKPPTFAMTIDPVPRTAEAGEPLRFLVNNTGTEWINGTMTLAAGREEMILYSIEVDLQLEPGATYEALWSGKDPDGEDPEPNKYLVAARVKPDEGPTPFAQDVFTLE